MKTNEIDLLTAITKVRLAELEEEITFLSGYILNTGFQQQAEMKRRVRDRLRKLPHEVYAESVNRGNENEKES